MDNTPALYWTKKGSTSTSVPAAYLLRLQALHQQKYCYHSRAAHIAGTANVMADNCSPLWHPMDTQLLTHFNSHHPQSQLWQQCTLWPEMSSALLSALQTKEQMSRAVPAKAIKIIAWWLIWLANCTEWEINPIQYCSTAHISDYLVAFAHNVHTGQISPSKKMCQLGSVETALCAICQKIALTGAHQL